MSERFMKEDKENTLHVVVMATTPSLATPSLATSSLATVSMETSESLDNADSDSMCSVSSDKLVVNEERRASTPSGKKKLKRRKEGLLAEIQDVHYYTDSSTGVHYRVGDTVYVAHKKGDVAHSVCTVLGFQANARGQMQVLVKHYYRATEVPDSVYLPLVNDRNAETKPGVQLLIKDPVVRTRELFRSEVTNSFPVTALKGKCRVVHYEDIQQVQHFTLLPDVFFYIYEYSPTTKRLATIQGEIRVGPSHQARLPECQPHVKTVDMPERCERWEDMTWKPTAVLDGDLVMYLRAARSMAAFAGMCDGGSTEDAFTAASMDETTIKALNMLHNSGYDTKKALGELVKRINPKSYERRWSEEDVKKFVKGLRSYGKDFFKIRKELLPNKDTGELVEYYYYWKKTPAANSSRPHRSRRQRQRKQANTPTRQTSTDDLDASSASGEGSEEESELSDSSSFRDLNAYYCRNCDTTKSKDWHHSGKKNQLLCTECRLYYEKHGVDRPQYHFKPVKEKHADSDSQESELSERKSPSSESVSSYSSAERADTLTSTAVTAAGTNTTTGGAAAGINVTAGTEGSNKRKEPPTQAEPEVDAKRPKQAEGSSRSESCISEGSSGFNDENANDGDVETNQEDATSSESSSPTDDVSKKSGAPYLNGIPRPIPKPAQPVPNPRLSAPVQPVVPSNHLPSNQLHDNQLVAKDAKAGDNTTAESESTSDKSEELESVKKEEKGIGIKAPMQGENKPLIPHGQTFQPVMSSASGIAPLLSMIKSEPMDTTAPGNAMQGDTKDTKSQQQQNKPPAISMQNTQSIKTEPRDVKPKLEPGQPRDHTMAPPGEYPRHVNEAGFLPPQRHAPPDRDVPAPIDLHTQPPRAPISAQERKDIHGHFVNRPPMQHPHMQQAPPQSRVDPMLGYNTGRDSARDSNAPPGSFPSDAPEKRDNSAERPPSKDTSVPQSAGASESPRNQDVSRESRDMRTVKEVHPRDSAERDPRTGLPRDVSLSRDPRELLRDPRELARDPRELARDPRELQRDPRDLPRDPRELPRDPRELPRDPRELGLYMRDPRDLLRDPRLLPPEYALDPRDPRAVAALRGYPREFLDPRLAAPGLLPHHLDPRDPRFAALHPLQARDSLAAPRDAHSPKSVTSRESPRLATRESPRPERENTQSPNRESHLSLASRSLSLPSQSVGLRASMPHIPSMQAPPGSTSASGAQHKLPQPPPLVSLPQASVPSTQPTVVSSSRTQPASHSASHPPSHPFSHPSDLTRRPSVTSHPSEHAREAGSDRARSRSPIRISESPDRKSPEPEVDSDSEPPRSPEPEARVVNEDCHRTKNAIFVRHLSRGWNSCSRCDVQFKPIPDSPLDKKRRGGGTSGAARKLSASSGLGSRPRDERRDERERAMERPASALPKKTDTPPTNQSADAQITSSLLHSPHHVFPEGGGPPGRLSPGARLAHPLAGAPGPGPERTPALNQLSRYAFGGHRPLPGSIHEAAIRAEMLARAGPPGAAGGSPYGPLGAAGLPPHSAAALLDPYRMAAMYPPNSRERLEWELEREKRERDARERDLRERELRELEFREKIKHDMEMKPPGFDRLLGPPDMYSELMKKYQSLPGAPPHGDPRLAAHAHHSALYGELLARERDRLERHGMPTAHLADPAFAERLVAEQRLHAERMQATLSDPLLRLPPQGAGAPGGSAGPPGPPHGLPPSALHLHQQQQNELHEAHLAAAAAAANGPPHPSHPGLGAHPLIEAARQSDMMYREMLSRHPYNTDPVLAQQLTVQAAAQQDQLQRQLLLERDRMSGGLPPPHHLP